MCLGASCFPVQYRHIHNIMGGQFREDAHSRQDLQIDNSLESPYNAVSFHCIGGLDSSLVASVACRHVRDHPDSESFSAFPRIHSFSVGLKDSPDLKV